MITLKIQKKITALLVSTMILNGNFPPDGEDIPEIKRQVVKQKQESITLNSN